MRLASLLLVSLTSLSRFILSDTAESMHAPLAAETGVAAAAEGWQCSLYLAPSRVTAAGMGVFAGKTHELGEEIDKASSLIVESIIIQNTPLINYVYSSFNGNYAAHLIGVAPMMNHMESPNTKRTILVDRHVQMDVQSVSLRPYSTYHSFSFTAKERIAVGQEIFGNYGDSSWFREREIPYNATESKSARDVPGYTLEELQTKGHCLSDAVVRESTIPMVSLVVLNKQIRPLLLPLLDYPTKPIYVT